MTYRNRKLLDLAHDMPCMGDYPHKCNGPSVPCHSNSLLFGRGHGLKTPDWAWAAGCPAWHHLIDHSPKLDKETKRYEWLRAYVKTQDYLWENGLVRTA